MDTNINNFSMCLWAQENVLKEGAVKQKKDSLKTSHTIWKYSLHLEECNLKEKSLIIFNMNLKEETPFWSSDNSFSFCICLSIPSESEFWVP